MSGSRMSSLDYDLEKGTISDFTFDRAESARTSTESRLSRRDARPRQRSRNYSRPSPPSSLRSIDQGQIVRRHRSSDDITEHAQIRREHIPQEFHPQEMPASPVSRGVPVFAQRAVQTAMLHDPPPIPPDTPPTGRRSRKSIGSTDVVEAAKRMPPSDWSSTRSLMSMIREKADLEPTTFAQRVFEAGKPDLLYDLRTSKRFKDQRHGVLDLTTLQRMSQHVLQQKLVEQVKAIGDRGAWMEIGIRETLHEYCKAVRDLEYMEQCALRGQGNDPFFLSTANPLECKLLEEVGLAFAEPKKQVPRLGPDRLEYTKRQSSMKQSMRRLLMALMGGLALIAPFLIMLLLDGQLVRLICTCAFTVVFAVGITLGSELGGDKIGLVTAAYAAALIV
ncbi:hypothetical protein B0A55_00774 [Friedmanniomyces simplex]|uniref:DUF6594 domain-containing protein n=1 Tax=Friedmanniomyces simplex TaxID=329884 RepID=A0A4V5NIK1_9PEZI|nr:hypothetical protein B0A55_00774 [Friedmanniomyces simplex]